MNMTASKDGISLNALIFNAGKSLNEDEKNAIFEKVKEVVKTDTYIKNEISPTGKNPIMLACMVKMEQLALYLIEHKVADLNTISNDGLTPLLFAMNFKLNNVVQELLQHNIDLTPREYKTNMDAFALACSSKNQELAIVLLEKLLNTETPQKELLKKIIHTPILSKTTTVFIVACKNRLFHIIRMLIKLQEELDDGIDYLHLDFLDPDKCDGKYYLLNTMYDTLRDKSRLEMEPASPESKIQDTVELFDGLFFRLLKLYGKKANKTYANHLPNGDNFKSSIMSMCVMCGFIRSLTYLINYANKTDLNLKTFHSNSVFSLVSEKFSGDWRTPKTIMYMFEIFVPKLKSIDVTTRDDNGVSAITGFMYYGYYKIILFLLEKNYVSAEFIAKEKLPDKNIIMTSCEKMVLNYYTTKYIHDKKEMAVQFDLLIRIINFVIERVPEFLLEKDANGNSFVHYCAGIPGSFPIIERIMKKDPSTNINTKTPTNVSALAMACFTNNVPVAKFLLNHPDIEYNVGEGVSIPILLACECSTQDIALELLKRSDIVLDKINLNNMTPFLLACSHGMSDVVLKLLDHPIDTVLSRNFFSITPDQMVSICNLEPSVKEKMDNMPLTQDMIGILYQYYNDEIVYDVYDGEHKPLQKYLDEDPDNFCFIVEHDGKRLYGLTKIKNMKEAISNSQNNPNIFYGCHNVMETYLHDYLWSEDADKYKIAMDNVDTQFLFTYLQKFALLNAFVYNHALDALMLYPEINHRCYFLQPNLYFQYKSVITSHLIDTTSSGSTGTTHCGSIAKPIMYNIVPCFASNESNPNPTKKRARSPTEEETVTMKKIHTDIPEGQYISVNYKDNLYHIEYTTTTTLKELKNMFLDKLLEKDVIKEIPETTNVMFVFLGKLFRTKGEEGETKLVKRDIVDKHPEYDKIVLVSNVSFPSKKGGRKTMKQRLLISQKKRTVTRKIKH